MGREAKFKKELVCALTEDEIAERTTQLLQAMKQKRRLEAEKKEMTSVFRDKIKGLEEREEELAKALETGSEARLIDCERVYHETRKRVVTIRLDTKQVIEQRPMTDAEVKAAADRERQEGEEKIASWVDEAMDSFERQMGDMLAAEVDYESHGLTRRQVNALHDGGYKTLRDFEGKSLSDIEALKGVTGETAAKVIEAVNAEREKIGLGPLGEEIANKEEDEDEQEEGEEVEQD